MSCEITLFPFTWLCLKRKELKKKGNRIYPRASQNLPDCYVDIPCTCVVGRRAPYCVGPCIFVFTVVGSTSAAPFQLLLL